MKTILLINEYFSDNVGDQAINEGVVKLFSDRGYQIKNSGFSRADNARTVTLNVNAPKKESNRLLASPLLRSFYWLLKNLGRVVKCSYKCDGIASIGGGQLILEKSSFAIAMFTWVFFLKLFRNKVIILSVGVGDSFGFYEHFLYKMSFKLVDDIYIREKTGILKLKQEFNIVAKFSPDAAYALNSPVANINTAKKISVYITSYDVHKRYAKELVLPILTHAEYLLSWKDRIHDYHLKGYNVHFSWTTQSDKNETLNFLASTKLDYDYSLFGGKLQIEDIMTDLNLSDLVIAGRMHALILAQVCNCEIVPWIISKKIEIFAQEYLCKEIQHLREQLNETLNEVIES